MNTKIMQLCFVLMGFCSNLFLNAESNTNLDPRQSFIFAPRGTVSQNSFIIGILKKKNGTPLENRKVKIFIDGRAYALVTSDNNGIFVYQIRPDINLSDGFHFVYAVDNIHNSYIRGTEFMVDSTKTEPITRSGNVSVPPSSILFPPTGYHVGQETFSIVCGLYDSGNTPVNGETMTLKIDSNVVSSSTQSNSNGTAVYQLTQGQALAEGNHTCDAYAQESDINLTQTQFVVDLTAPEPPVITVPENFGTVTTSPVVVSGTAEPEASVVVFLDEDTYGEISYADGNGDWTVDLYNVENGEHTIFARQTDLALLESENSDIVNFTVSV